MQTGEPMKFKFTQTALKDLPLGTVVDGYCLTARSYTGRNAEGYKCAIKQGKVVPVVPFERILLIYSSDSKT